MTAISGKKSASNGAGFSRADPPFSNRLLPRRRVQKLEFVPFPPQAAKRTAADSPIADTFRTSLSLVISWILTNSIETVWTQQGGVYPPLAWWQNWQSVRAVVGFGTSSRRAPVEAGMGGKLGRDSPFARMAGMGRRWAQWPFCGRGKQFIGHKSQFGHKRARFRNAGVGRHKASVASKRGRGATIWSRLARRRRFLERRALPTAQLLLVDFWDFRPPLSRGTEGGRALVSRPTHPRPFPKALGPRC